MPLTPTKNDAVIIEPKNELKTRAEKELEGVFETQESAFWRRKHCECGGEYFPDHYSQHLYPGKVEVVLPEGRELPRNSAFDMLPDTGEARGGFHHTCNECGRKGHFINLYPQRIIRMGLPPDESL